MKRISGLLLICTGVFAQSGRVIMSGHVSSNDVSFSYETHLEPALPASKGIGGGGTFGFHRYMTDFEHHWYFGYDIAIEHASERDTFRVTLRSLTLNAEELELPEPKRWLMLSLPGVPAPQMVHKGDVIALDLLENLATHQKITDYIQVPAGPQATPIRSTSANFHGPPDPSNNIQLDSPRITVNGQLQHPPGNHSASVIGSAVWIYVPGLGRYLLSINPNTELGLTKAGEISGGTLTFMVNGQTVIVNCNSRIAGDSVYPVYALHQPEWRPLANEDSVKVGVATSMKALVNQ